jgi:hypothetical protein
MTDSCGLQCAFLLRDREIILADNIWGHSSDPRAKLKREVCPLSLVRGEGLIVLRGSSPFFYIYR